MPNGWWRPSAKTEVCWGLPSGVTPRKMRILPGWLSATKRSPLGAVRMRRGLSRPVVYSSTLKPAGALGQASAGLGTMLGPLSTASFSFGAGRSLTVRWRRVPGDSCAASVKASCPVRTLVVDWVPDFWLDLDCEECLAAEAPIETRQKIVQIRIWLLRKRYMTPLGEFVWQGRRPDASPGKDARRRAGEAREMQP